ncbi:hypothetical protein MRX96_024505 [Rhipicephalus microplus]
MDGSESAGARASTSTRLDKICTFCDKAFSTASNLKRHIKKMSMEKRPWQQQKQRSAVKEGLSRATCVQSFF